MDAVVNSTTQGIANTIAAVGGGLATAVLGINGLKYFKPTTSKGGDDAYSWIIRGLVGLVLCLAPATILATIRAWTGL